MSGNKASNQAGRVVIYLAARPGVVLFSHNECDAVPCPAVAALIWAGAII